MTIPHISVCVPTYNGERYLRQCLDSIHGQSWRDFEVLIVDDGSTDATMEICAEFALKDARLRIERNPCNLGLVSNWNRCIELANSDWIKFVFQDDLLKTDCLEKMIARASRPIVFCDRDFLFEEGTDPTTIAVYNNLPNMSTFFGDHYEISADSFCDAILSEPRNFFGEPTVALLHRSIFSTYGKFNSDLAQLCDLEFWSRVATNTGAGYVGESLATFRFHQSSVSASNRSKLRDERISVFDNLIISHEFAFNSHYSKLRNHGKSLTPARDLSREFTAKASWVSNHARALATKSTETDATWRDSFERLAGRYPNLSSGHDNFSYRARAFWDRHLGWRLK